VGTLVTNHTRHDGRHLPIVRQDLQALTAQHSPHTALINTGSVLNTSETYLSLTAMYNDTAEYYAIK